MFERQTYGVLIEMLGNVSRRMESVISNNRWGGGGGHADCVDNAEREEVIGEGTDLLV